MADWTFALQLNGVTVDTFTVSESGRYGPETTVNGEKATAVALDPGDVLTVVCTDRPEPPDPGAPQWTLNHVAIRVKK